MNIKIINIITISLLIGIIPSTSIPAVISSQEDCTLWLRGFVVINEIEKNIVYAQAIRLHYFQWTKSEGSFGTITFTEVSFPDEYNLILFGKLIYVIGISKGKIVF